MNKYQNTIEDANRSARRALATVADRGRGLPEPGDWAQGPGGEAYRITEVIGVITSRRSRAYAHVAVELADWHDLPDGAELYRATAIGAPA